MRNWLRAIPDALGKAIEKHFGNSQKNILTECYFINMQAIGIKLCYALDNVLEHLLGAASVTKIKHFLGPSETQRKIDK